MMMMLARMRGDMSDFGHTTVNGPNFHVDVWGAGPFVIKVLGKEFRFEDSDRFGPMKITKRGEIAADPIFPDRSPFWPAYEDWVKGGRQTEDDGATCKHAWDGRQPIDAIMAIEDKLAELNLTQSFLADLIGSSSHASEIMSGKRKLSKKMMVAIHIALGIPLFVLMSKGDSNASPNDGRLLETNPLRKTDGEGT